jgi:hypothetical protein
MTETPPPTRKEALAQGLKHYFTGKPCKHGHTAIRFASTKQCSACVDAHNDKWRADNRASHLEWRRTYRKKSDTPERRAAAVKRAKQWAQSNREHLNQWSRQYKARREAQDLGFKIQRRLQARIWAVVAKGSKSASTLELLGCSCHQLLAHLANQFAPGMSWDNYGEWHIDHIRPCASFDLLDPEQQRQCFHWSNLQPLWAADNIRKHAKWSHD